jgi:hypothetical protein
MTEKRERPAYTGMHKHQDFEAGYGVWLPSDWHRIDLQEGHQGVIYSPYPYDPQVAPEDQACYQTCFFIEKHKLDLSVRAKDFDIIQKGFLEGIQALPEVEIKSHDESIGTAGVVLLDARYTYVENGLRRMRWTRVTYWGNGQLTMIAQAADEDEFAYWEGMFYNTMMTIEL